MAFIRATIEIRPASVGTGIKCGLRRGKKTAAVLSFFLSTSVAKTLNLVNGDKVDVLIGDGPDHGMLRLRKNNSVGVAEAVEKTTGKGAFFQIKLGHQPMFVDRSEPSAWCPWELAEDGWAEVVLPKWADETHPTKRAKPAVTPAPVSQPAQPVKARESVTSALMGDPPPGRREMLAKVGNLAAK